MNRSERFKLKLIACPEPSGEGADSRFQADVAQLVEHSLGKGEVISSILIIGSMN